MRALYINLILCIFAFSCSSQNNPEAESELYSYQELITADYLRDHLEVIAHDTLEGRGTGEAGLKKAADYLADVHAELGLTPIGDDDSYFQYFDLNSRVLEQVRFITSTLSNGDTQTTESIFQPGEAASYTLLSGGEQSFSGEVVFAGFGAVDAARNVDNFGSEDVAGKWVMVFQNIPHVVGGDTLIAPEYDERVRLNEILGARNAAGVIIIPNMNEQEYMQASRAASYELGSPISLSLDHMPTAQQFPGTYLSINPDYAAEQLGVGNGELLSFQNELANDIQDFQAYQTSTHLEINPEINTEPIETQNVVSYFEGSDPDLKEEVVVLMAHYDHLGTGVPDETGDRIFNGADDNGSGTVTMLSIARSLTEAAQSGVRPRRSIVFLHVSAEEWGLLGSRYYSDNPIIPIDQTVANINMDMIGRRDQMHIEQDEEDFIYIIGAEIISSDMDSLLQEANQKSTDLTLNMRYNDLDDPNQFYRRSDHWNFGRLEVPFIFFFSGVHEDYHSQSDSVDDVLFGALEKRARLIYATTLEIANADEAPEVDSEEFIRRTRQ
ncbi:MAG: M28 family peptidase [Balneolales bacterium]